MKCHLHKLRTSRGWSQTELSNRSGVSTSHISDIERDNNGMTAEIACKFAKALEVELGELIECESEGQT